MISLTDLDPHTLVRSLRMTVCPCCGAVKKPSMSMCRSCYFRLPPPMRKAMYNLLGEGYAEAMVEALNFLEAERFVEPPAKI